MKENNRSGIGFGGLLAILFIGLKLGNIIDWPWFWVLSPVIISLGLGLSIIMIALVVGILTKD